MAGTSCFFPCKKWSSGFWVTAQIVLFVVLQVNDYLLLVVVWWWFGGLPETCQTECGHNLSFWEAIELLLLKKNKFLFHSLFRLFVCNKHRLFFAVVIFFAIHLFCRCIVSGKIIETIHTHIDRRINKQKK